MIKLAIGTIVATAIPAIAWAASCCVAGAACCPSCPLC